MNDILYYAWLVFILLMAGKGLYTIIKCNKENGLFYYTVFQMYLRKRGLSNEEISKETYEWSRCHNELFDAIGLKAISEDKYRDKIVEFRKKNNLDI